MTITVEAILSACRLDRQWCAANAKVHIASEARRALPPGSSRAKVTSANARWSIAAEARARIEKEIRARLEAGL